MTEIPFEDAKLVHMPDGQPLPSDREQGLSSPNVNSDDAATHDDGQHASTLEDTDSTTALSGIVDDNLNSVDKLALVSSVSMSHKMLLISNRSLQKLWNVQYHWNTLRYLPQHLNLIVSQRRALLQ